MLIFPTIDPVAFHVGPLQVHWYGLMYLSGFMLAWALAYCRRNKYTIKWSSEEISDLIFYTALGVIIGGRIGYMIFYNTQVLFTSPLIMFKIWEGGMSFHGGLIGVLIALYCFSCKLKRPFWSVVDFLAPLVPLGLGLGRIGNFINGELWGRTTNMPWGMIFPNADGLIRHPSQLYEFLLEGILLFLVVWIYSNKQRPYGRVSAVFLIGYAICRIIVEFFREPDVGIGFIAFHWLTMGQLLSFFMLSFGLILWIRGSNEKLS